MPQMAPINWTLMYLVFSATLILTIIMNYYLFMYQPVKFTQHSKTKNINWKW
uniref:ATP synthase complex subunit 8 n=1 Tax=Scolytinae sp. BMNH 1274292 TaxID=2558040 RepID=A0A126TFB7_9CUCU|nr:ATP synthase F0 subunit 8 [Scolytinae sp. BMNH 1274292]